MSKRKKRGWQGVVTAVLAMLMLGYIGFQAYRSVFSQVNTELAVVHSVYETIDTEGLVYRTETVLPANKSGYPYFTIENGTRVAKNSVIASVYRDDNSGHIEQEIAQIDQQIQAFQSIEADAGSDRLTLDNISDQTKNTLYKLVQNTNNGNFEEVGTAQFDLLSLLSKKQLITGKPVDFTNKIKQLKDEKKALQARFRSPSSKIYAPVAGYFVDRTDGYESVLKTDDLTNLTVGQLNRYMEDEPSANTAYCGKIVSGYEWFMACVLPDSYYNVLGVGKNLSIRMSFVLDEAVPATVYACNKDNNGHMAVVFRCDYMSSELSTVRKEAVQIQLVEHTGLKVPKRAIVIDENQQAGVYVRSGNVVSFRKIEQIFSEPAEYVVCEIVNEDGYLRMYDDIIVGGKDLYDGKIIH